MKKTSINTIPYLLFKTKLLENFSDIKSWSITTINNFLKNDLKLSFKKRYYLEPKMFKPENVTNLWQWAMLLHMLDNDGLEIIYFDEFSVSARHLNWKGWSK